MDQVELLKWIDKYLKGTLNDEEKDRLWAVLLENPEYYELFKTEVNLQKKSPKK